MFVEAHTAGADDWTTLADLNGHTSRRHRLLVPVRLAGLHPFLDPLPDRQRRRQLPPRAARTGVVVGRDRRQRRLRAVDGRPVAVRRQDVEVSISYASDDTCSATGVFVDDIVGLDRRGLDLVRGRRRHARRLDRARARPTAAPATTNDWIVGDRRRRAADAVGDVAAGSFAREPEILDFLGRALRAATRSRPPAGSSTTSRGSASPWRTRPGRSTAPDFFDRPGDRATPSSSTSSPTSGSATASRSTAGRTSGSTRASPRTPSGCGASARASAPPRRTSTSTSRRSRPTTRSGRCRSATRARLSCSTSPVYSRGAMTLHALRLTVGDDDFFRHPAAAGRGRTPAAT